VNRTAVPVETIAGDAPAERALRVETIIGELQGAAQLLRCAGTGRLVRQGVSMTHIHVLWLLDEHGELPMHEVAELLGLSLPNTSGLIDRMEERGLVERVHDRDDRRVVRVLIAPPGRAALDEVQLVKDDLAVAVLGRMTDQQLERLAGSVSDFRTALRAEADARPGLLEACQRDSNAHSMETNS